MDKRLLTAFLTVADELHFTRAAEKLHIAQSALSAQIKSLEMKLGVTLFDRNRRSKMTLTAAGEAFRPEAARIVKGMDRAQNIAQRAERGATGVVRIGYVATAAFSGVLPSSLARIRKTLPGLEVRIQELYTPQQLKALVEGETDLGFARWRPTLPPGISSFVVLKDRFLIALPESHPLASKRSITPDVLARERFITPHFDEEFDFRRHIAALAELGGFEPTLAPPVRNFVETLCFVSAGYGVSPVPASLANAQIPGVVLREISGSALTTRLVGMYRSDEAAPAVQRLVEAVREHFRREVHPVDDFIPGTVD